MTSKEFVYWLMGFLEHHPCPELENGKRDCPGSGLTIHEYKAILKALRQVKL
jgi:hypothetical protein